MVGVSRVGVGVVQVMVLSGCWVSYQPLGPVQKVFKKVVATATAAGVRFGRPARTAGRTRCPSR